MTTIPETISDLVEENGKNLAEIFKERLFNPMYFYFIIAWVIANWNFVYTFLFADEELVFKAKCILKVEFLSQFYKFDSLGVGLWSISKLLIIPMISTYVAVWWLSRLSEKFFERNEEYKSNKRVIERKLEYSEKVKISREQKEIRDLESDKKSIRWEDNSEFNQSIDDVNNVLVSGIDMQPSEVLYNSDYEAYKEQLEEWKNNKNNTSTEF